MSCFESIVYIFQEDSSLVTISSKAENKFILGMVQDTSPTTSEIWLGTFRGKGGKAHISQFFCKFWFS